MTKPERQDGDGLREALRVIGTMAICEDGETAEQREMIIDACREVALNALSSASASTNGAEGAEPSPFVKKLNEIVAEANGAQPAPDEMRRLLTSAKLLQQNSEACDCCPNCGGEGVVYSCFEEWACIDPEGGCDLCEQRCDWCRPRKPSQPAPPRPDGKQP